MNHLERYKSNFAKVVYRADHTDDLDDTDVKQMYRLFDTFSPDDHAAIANYPLWIVQPKNWTPRDRRRFKQYQRAGKDCMFLFSHKRIQAYLDNLGRS